MRLQWRLLFALGIVKLGTVTSDLDHCGHKGKPHSVTKRQHPKPSITQSHLHPKLHRLYIAVIQLIGLTVAKQTCMEGIGGDPIDLSCKVLGLIRRKHRDDVLK